MCRVEWLHGDVVQVAWQWLSNCICSHPTHHQLDLVYSGGLSVRGWGLHVWIVCNGALGRHINSPVKRTESVSLWDKRNLGFYKKSLFMGSNWWTWGVYNKYTCWKPWLHFARVLSDNLGLLHQHKVMELYNHLSQGHRWTETCLHKERKVKSFNNNILYTFCVCSVLTFGLRSCKESRNVCVCVWLRHEKSFAEFQLLHVERQGTWGMGPAGWALHAHRCSQSAPSRTNAGPTGQECTANTSLYCTGTTLKHMLDCWYVISNAMVAQAIMRIFTLHVVRNEPNVSLWMLDQLTSLHTLN